MEGGEGSHGGIIKVNHSFLDSLCVKESDWGLCDCRDIYEADGFETYTDMFLEK